MKVAFFDFDGTITNHDSFILFSVFCLGRKALLKGILKNSFNLILWKLGYKSNSQVKQLLFSTLFKGKNYNWFKTCGIQFKNLIKRDLNPIIYNNLKSHLESNHKVVIVSASIPEWITPWASEIGIELVLGTEIETDNNGIITGSFRTPNCYGMEKVNRIKAAFPNLTNIETWGYGDSVGDKQMLDLVCHPVKVK